MASIDIVVPADLSENGVSALSGGKTLRAEFATPTNLEKLRSSRKAALKPPARLHAAFVGMQYGTPLTVRIAKARSTCIFTAEEEDAQHLRYLGNMYDQVGLRCSRPCLSKAV